LAGVAAEVGVAATAITAATAVVISATAGADTSARIIDRRQIGVIATLDPNRKIKSGVSSADAPDFYFWNVS
jgi:hypothetical protein